MIRNDRDLLKDFENAVLPSEAFHHREHVRVAWVYLSRMEYSAAERRMAQMVRNYAEHHGASSKYHHTLTLVWMRLVAAAMRENPGFADSEEFACAHPELLDREAPGAFYSPSRLRSEAARSGWVEPDLRPLPI